MLYTKNDDNKKWCTVLYTKNDDHKKGVQCCTPKMTITKKGVQCCTPKMMIITHPQLDQSQDAVEAINIIRNAAGMGVYEGATDRESLINEIHGGTVV